MKALIPLYVKMSLFARDRADRMKERAEGGQNTLEYVGLTLLIVGVIVLISQRANLDGLANKFQQAVQKILDL